MTSFLDSPAHNLLLQTVPTQQRPPVLLAIYADALDCDNLPRSSAKHKVHCTYVQVINARKYGYRYCILLNFVIGYKKNCKAGKILGQNLITIFQWL